MPITPEAPAAGLLSRRAFDHILIIMFENQYRSYVLANPYMRRLARQGIQLGNSFGVMHPSQTNYIASIAGALCNVTSDGRPAALAERTIVDLIEEAPGRIRWKGYMESYVREAYPWTPTFCPQDAPPYFIKHNPFSSFASIVRNEARWRQIDNEAGLFADLLNGEFPEFAWFTPNIWSDGHWVDGTEVDPRPRAPVLVDQSARWLEGFFHRLRFPGPRSHLPPRTLVVITFDESDFEEDYLPDLASTYDGPNQIYTLLLGDGLEPAFEEEGYNHYSLLRTVEKNFGLDHLGKNDAGANWFQFLWGLRFDWSGPQATPFDVFDGPLAAAGFAGALFVGCAASDGTTRLRTRSADHGRWSAEETLADRRIGRARHGLDLHGAGAGSPFRLRSPAVHEIRSAARVVAGARSGRGAGRGSRPRLVRARDQDNARFPQRLGRRAIVRSLFRGLGQAGARCPRPAATAR